MIELEKGVSFRNFFSFLCTTSDATLVLLCFMQVSSRSRNFQAFFMVAFLD